MYSEATVRQVFFKRDERARGLDWSALLHVVNAKDFSLILQDI